MGKYNQDKRVVLTLDAGGQSFRFNAMKGEEFILETLAVPSHADNLDRCLESLRSGFSQVAAQLGDIRTSAISFAFPGPADYPAGIIGGYLPNFPAFREGVALGPFLQEQFGIPVFINNDGDLFAFGEALSGALPAVNARLEALGSRKRYRNLIGYTIGTGFGVGCVIDGRLNRGDNSCVETFCLPNPFHPGVILEDSVSIRAVQRVYRHLSGENESGLTPKDIFDIAEGRLPGDRQAACKAFGKVGRAAGQAIATAAQLMDGLVVIGGGISASAKYFMPALLEEMRGTVQTLSGDTLGRLQMKVYNLDDEAEFASFARGEARELKVYGTEKTVTYDPQKRIGVCIDSLGTSKAISVGAYDFALSELDGD